MATSSSSASSTPAPEPTDAPAPEPAAPSVVAPAPDDRRPSPVDPSEPVDRSTYVGPINVRDPEIETPDNYVDASKAPKGKTVDVFQVLGSNNALMLRFDGAAFLLDREQAAALGKDIGGAAMNVTY